VQVDVPWLTPPAAAAITDVVPTNEPLPLLLPSDDSGSVCCNAIMNDLFDFLFAKSIKVSIAHRINEYELKLHVICTKGENKEKISHKS